MIARRSRRAAPPLALLGLLVLGACENRDAALNRIAQRATTAGYDAARAQIESKAHPGLGWLPDAVLVAGDRLRAGETNLTFTRAVLDVAKTRQELTNPNALLYLHSVAALAHHAALAAYDSGDLELAHHLVFAGPTLWQSEHYWRTNPNHDALASIILYHRGERIEAAERIQYRASLNEELLQLYDELRRAR